MRRLAWTLIGLAAAAALAGCGPSPYVRDPGCKAMYDACMQGCPVGPPVSPFGVEQAPSFEMACRNGCYTDARACESRAAEREGRPAGERGPEGGGEGGGE